EVNGSVDLRATLPDVTAPVAPAAVQAGGTVTLKPSRIAGLSLNEATLTGRYAERAASIDRLDITGPDLTAHAAGSLALNDSGASDLTLQVAAPRLDQIGRIANVPLTGIAKLEATITGNRQALQATGRFTGDGVRYAGNGALTIGTDFTARVPDLQPADGDVSATTHATFVSLGGQHINELDAKTDYRGQQLAFDATARQPERTLTAAGNAGFDPADQNVRLRRLALQSRGMSWQLRSGAHPVVRWGHGAVAVSDLQLVDGGQQIAVDGTVGQPGRALKVRLNHVQLATIDALLLRPPQLTGTLDATGTIAGTLTSPHVEAEAHVADGGFRRFKYDALNATAAYRDRTVDLDARLQQNPASWIDAQGAVPIDLFTGAAAGSTAPVDLHVDSSPIDLGLVQGFTTALSGVKGTLQANVHVTGTAGDPHASGSFSIDNGAFTVQPTGVGYRQLDGRIDLQPDRIHIPGVRVLDDRQKPLTISGDLAFHERQVGEMSIAVKADDFKVLDDKMGSLRINSNLQMTGELSAPRVDGDLGIVTGEIRLDPILAKVGTSVYATKPTEYASAATSEGQKGASSRFDPMQVELHVTIPDDLVVKADNLQAPGSPIGLGALNLTLGGDLWISKTPWDQVRLVGPVRTIRGTYDFQGRRFTILRDGTVRFEGGDEIDPALDVRTQRVIQAVTAYVTLGGTLKKPAITLSSVPPLEQADVLSLIVFNQPLSNLGEGQQISLAQRAESLATGAIAGELAKSIGNALNLDTFEINVAPVTGGGPEVTLGGQLGQNLFVRVEQGIGAESVTNFVLEYEIARWLRLRTNVLEGSTPQQQVFQRSQDSGVDMLFVFSY
ncbi:MAG: translocation/assembly module TamB domain-containing protein, partial [Betaproteobacteria bacterium]